MSSMAAVRPTAHTQKVRAMVAGGRFTIHTSRATPASSRRPRATHTPTGPVDAISCPGVAPCAEDFTTEEPVV
ncbi:hypothetical protein IY73_03895 [Lawsonella clevelandensis]|uniref:Uncharacterized protein n=1 Tax=Lawsonella clevelandensis TaxID=1528099 RepID=A0A0M4LYN1_9ACTN|nr:hypothetical protein AL705_03975 [Lawsonella clevelandensis]ALE34615.1 hypothetical protein IY73_03895 [Lawsonella clevelandensis]